MILRNTLTIGLVTLGLFACTEKTKPIEKDEVEVSKESDQNSKVDTEQSTVEKEAPIIKSFTNESVFTITTDNMDERVTGFFEVDIFVNNDLLKAPIKITREATYEEVSPGDMGVPKNAVFAFSTWFGGGGSVFYGIVKDGILQIIKKDEHEEMAEAGVFALFGEIDPNVQTKNPDYYISYNSDDNKSKELMIGFTKNGKAQYVKYAGQSRHLELRHVKEENEERNFMDYYNEIVNGEVNGKYKLTHSGNWDYVEYTPKNSDKRFKFTINHDATIVGDTYRTTPSF